MQVTPIAPPTGCGIRPVPNRNLIASSECAKLKHVRLAKYGIIADHVTFMQPIRWRVVAESFPTFVHSRELLCELLEKAIVRCYRKQKGRHNIESCFIDKAVA